ncbi:hypothetical protein [Microbulbifer hydrolyticus]|uniref:Phage holin family protein n=1 Tax=Microbulbifer hydrolyticus TaxID=48074 RepID=A0A6P1T9D2_9GAMM|nr:hypothetical protein [Microbulbifer hydrolyticus]MBB5212865.1 hypothetical protein [Microbulbifer hydrolyticus]QHQ38345.1 hypothetical protein GTQ55_04610 [Microbulbifer hydrolyticus]
MAGPDKPGKHPHGRPTDDGRAAFQDESPETAAGSRSHSRYDSEYSHTDSTDTAAKAGSDIDALMQRAEATMTLATAWSENFTRLVHLEFQRTLGAGKRIVLLLMFLFFLAIALIVSVCAGLGLLGYYFFQSVYIGFAIFMVSQLLIIGGLGLSINSLRKLLGFEESKKQAREALNDVTALFKQTD